MVSRLPSLLLLAASLSAADPVFSVDPGRVLRDDADRWLGINLNYIRDADANRPAGSRPLTATLDDLGVRWLRFPGGEKSDYHRFAAPPYAKAEPLSLGGYADLQGVRLDFDAYIEVCRKRGAEPYVVVACESQKNCGATWDEQLAHAVAWVRYAQEKGYSVRYWEIGNENWHNQTAPPAEMAVQVVRFARAMKAVDHGIRVGASGNHSEWWQTFLPLAAADLDFLTVSVYNCWEWKSYDRLLRDPEPDLLAEAGHALRAINALPAGPDRERLRVIITETNSRDYSKDGWGHANNLGHAIVIFESFGRFLREPHIAAAMLWTTRWVKVGKAHTDIFYALDDDNTLTASGLAVALWGRHLHSHLLAVEGNTGSVRAYASANADGSAWTVWLVNRGLQPATGVRVRGLSGGPASWYRISGSSPDDTLPIVTAPAPMTLASDGIGPLELPPLSITVMCGTR